MQEKIGFILLLLNYGAVPANPILPLYSDASLKYYEHLLTAHGMSTNAMIHEDLGIPTVQEVIHARSTKHRIKLETHSNSLLHPIARDNVVRILKRRWTADL